jgi:replicative DNA helicase
MSDKKLNDVSNEILFVCSLFKNPELYIEYGNFVRPKYDFDDESTRFLYEQFELYYQTYSQEMSEEKFNIFIVKDEDKVKKYKSLNRWNFIEEGMSLVDLDGVKTYFDILKKWSLLRELSKKGYAIDKIMNYKKFELLTADKILQAMRANLDKIQTVVTGQSDSVVMGKNIVSRVAQWREIPALGDPLAWDIWTHLFRGWREEKLIIDGMLSNEGKSRRLSLLAIYTSLILNKPILVMVNEMSQEDMEAAMLTAVCNNPIFGFNLNVPERNIVLGEYDSEEQFNAVLEVAEYFQENTKVYFQDMANSYSDSDIEYQVKKHVLGLGVTHIFYDTLKGYKTDNWETVKQTATTIKNICKTLKIKGYATIQLTDDSVFIPVEDFSSNNIANAKQLKHVVDHMLLEKKIDRKEYSNYAIVNDEWGGQQPLNPKKTYYGQKVDKNRAGAKGMVLASEVDLDLNIWREVGYLVMNNTENKKKK